MSNLEGRELATEFAEFVQALGVLRSDSTPCGQPMSVSTAHALCDLRRSAPVSQKALARRLGLETSTVSRLVDQLAAKGWAIRTPDRSGQDNRVRLISLTPEGVDIAEQVGQARAARFSDLLNQLETEQRPLVREALQLLKEAAHAIDNRTPTSSSHDRSPRTPW